MTLTRPLREELAHLSARTGPEGAAELAAMIRFGGTLQLRGGTPTRVSVVVRCTHASVARRLRASLVTGFGVKPTLSQSRGGNLVGSSAYLLEVSGPVLRQLDVLDDDGRPRAMTTAAHTSSPMAYLAGAVMMAGRLSGTGRPVHFEVVAPSESTAAALAAMLDRTATGMRLVIKGGRSVGELLVGMGAHATFLTFEEGLVRRDLRGNVNRSVNADRANVRRATDAAAQQIHSIQALVDRIGWDGVPDDLHEVALARLASPEATLTELGELLDPAVGKATVHRRLTKLQALAQEVAEG